MGDTLYEYMHLILNCLIFISAISMLILFTDLLHKGSNNQIENMKYRPAVSMEGETSYAEDDVTVRGTEVFADILGQKNNVTLAINGNIIPYTLIRDARMDDEASINRFRTFGDLYYIQLNDEYIPITYYDDNSELTGIDYVLR